MAKEFGAREKFFALNGLVCLAQSLKGKHTTVDLRNETSVYGKVDEVDVFMNINMTDVVFINGRGEKHKFDNFFIQARNVRYVHIPNEVPIIGAIKQQLGKVTNMDKKQKFDDKKKSFKVRRAIKTQQETIGIIEKLKEERLKKEAEKCENLVV